jgi:CheY-like chemotaxis protein
MIQQEAEKIGINKFLSKPVKLHELVNLLSYLFEKSYLKKDADVSIPAISRFEEKVQVLVAEDNVMNMLLITEVLNNMGLHVLQATNGQEAVDLLQTNDPAVIFMDVNMPVIDGFTATRMIREMSDAKKSTPIIALTADAMKEDRERCLAMGMNDFVSKPFRLKEIEFVLKNYISQVKADAIITPMYSEDKRQRI